MTTIHLIYGEPAVTALRQALEAAGRPDRVIALRDDLTVGPLRDIDVAGNPGVAQRAAFWERLGDAPPALAHDDCAALNALEADDSHVVIWHTHDAAHQLALRRVCYRLRDVPQRLNEVRLTADEISGPSAAARIEARLPDAAPISVLRITRLALEWQEAKFANGETRRWRDNTFTSGSFAELDALIVEDAVDGWQFAGRVAARVMAADNGLLVSDTLLLWRLRELAAAGQLQLRGETEMWRSLELNVPRATLSPA